MSQQLQEIFNRIEQSKKEVKNLNDSYKDTLANSPDYQKIDEELKAIRARKKEIELGLRDDFGADFEKIEQLKLEISTDKELLSDLAMSMLMRGEKVEITDPYDTQYEPIFRVSFKKTN